MRGCINAAPSRWRIPPSNGASLQDICLRCATDCAIQADLFTSTLPLQVPEHTTHLTNAAVNFGAGRILHSFSTVTSLNVSDEGMQPAQALPPR